MLSKFIKKTVSFTLTTSLCFMMTANAAFANSSDSKKTPKKQTEKMINKQAQKIVNKMTVEEKVGQMLMPDFRTWNGGNFTQMNDEVANVIKTYHLGGVILFAENIQETQQTVRLTDGLQKASTKIPLLITTDQEGGIVTRINGGTCMPGNMALGAANDTDLTYRTSNAMAEEVKALGMNVDFAPDMDVNCNPDNPVIGVRSFGGDPDLVSRMGLSFMKGVQDAGVIPTVKHFPGHGDVSIDSHVGLPVVPYDMARLNAVELKPFKAAIGAGVDVIMSAHIQFPAVDNSTVTSKKDGTQIMLPATLSKKVLTGLLRGKMGYKGVIVTDALNMGAIADNFGQNDDVIRAINAGADIGLMPATIHQTSDLANFDSMFKAVVNAVNDKTIDMSRINDSATRLIALKIKRGIYNPRVKTGTTTLDQKIANATATVGSVKHKAIEKEAANKGVTLIKNDDNILPFKLADAKKILCIAPLDTKLVAMTQEVKSMEEKKGLKDVQVDGVTYANSFVLDDVTKSKIDKADYVVLGTYSYDSASRQADSSYVKYANEVINYAQSKGKLVAVMGIRNPYEINQIPNAKDFIAVYGADGIQPTKTWQNIQAGMRVIFGEVSPTGKLPVAIPTADNTGILHNIGFGLNYSQQVQ